MLGESEKEMSKKSKCDEDLKIIIKYVVHHIILTLLVLIMIGAIGYFYITMKNVNKNDLEPPVSTNSKGMAHPLPDFIIDKIKPDELEQLKP